MRTIWALALLGLVMLVPLASAGDVASSEASGVLGVGTDNEDDQGEDLKTLTHKDTHAGTHDGGSGSGWVGYLSTTLGLVVTLLIIGLLLVVLALAVRYLLRK